MPTKTPTTPNKGLSPREESRLRHKLRRSAPSEPWIDAQIKTLTDTSADGQQIIYRFHDPRPFPPGGSKKTKMKYCRQCGRYSPPNSIHLIEHAPSRKGTPLSATLQCDDCRIATDEQNYKELYNAGLFLKPASSMSFVRKRELQIDRLKG